MKLLSEVLSVNGLIFVAKTDANPVLPYLEMILTRVLSVTLSLPQKEENELAINILRNILFSLTHTCPVRTWPAQCKEAGLCRLHYPWAKEQDLEKLEVEW